MSFEVSADAYGRFMEGYSHPLAVAFAGLAGARATAITVQARYASFEEWWEPLTLGVGPAGGYVQSLTERARAGLRARLREHAGQPPVEISATAWTVTCRA